jgi:MoaA/NifB/PqqE/SkfB family radical SAM enzyme
MTDFISLIGVNHFTSSAIEEIQSEISKINGNLLLPTVSLCHHCHSHVPAWRYHKDGKVYIAKHCRLHGISHHMIESDYEFYSGIHYTQDNPRYNFNGGVLIEVTDRCNLSCPHCYHEPDNSLKDQSIETILNQIKKWPLGIDAIERVILSGAEPTLRKDFTKLVNAIKNLNPNITVTVMTNGICFSDIDYLRKAKESGLNSINIGLNHPSYNDHAVIRKKQLTAINNAHLEDMPISYISYTMMSLDEVDFIMNEICGNEWRSKNFRIRYGSDIGRNPGQERKFVSDIYKSIEQWCILNNKSFERIVEADNNIYHVMACVDGKDIRIIQWCDETDIDMEELRSGPWCDFVPDGITNFLHQIIRRDAWKNQRLMLPDTPPDRYKFNNQPHDTPLDLLNLTWSSNNHEPLV